MIAFDGSVVVALELAVGDRGDASAVSCYRSRMQPFNRGVTASFVLLNAISCGPGSSAGTAGTGTEVTVTTMIDGDEPTSGTGPTTSRPGGSTTETSGADSGSGTSSAPQPTVCESYCAYYLMCKGEELAPCLERCESPEPDIYSYLGEACEDLHDASQICVGKLTDCDADDVAACDDAFVDSDACVLPQCQARCNKAVECSGEPDELCGLACSAVLAGVALNKGDACGEALKGLYACEGARTCEQAAADIGCEEELAVFDSCSP